MNTRAIEVVGTYQGFWSQWVRQVLARAGHAVVHTNPPSSQDLDAILCKRPDSGVLVLVEHPAVGLAHLLGRGDDIDPEAWLDDWLDSARTLLAYAQRNPDTTLMVNADEVLRRPQRLARLLQSRWENPFAAPTRVVQDAFPDALTQAFAWSFVERDLALQDIVPELLASCVILPGYRSANARLGPEGLFDGAGAARRLAELMQTERHLAQVKNAREAERDALRCELQAATEKCAQLTATVQSLEIERGKMMARINAADRALADIRSRLKTEVRERNTLSERLSDITSRQESITDELTAARVNATALDRQLNESRTVLAQAEGRQRTLEQELIQAANQRSTFEQRLAQVTKQQSSLEQELAQATKQRSSLEQELAQATKQRSSLEQELSGAKEARRAAIEESNLLLLQLHQVQEDLERVFLEKRNTENALVAAKAEPNPKKLEQDLHSIREECELLTLQTHQTQQELERVHAEKVRLTLELKSRIAMPGFDEITISEVVIIGERDTPPHREVSFIVRGVRAGERHIAEAAVRLVEHWGRPGLVVFSDEGAAPLLETWRESGREDGRPYMLLIYGEESAQRVYDAMGTLDWLLVQALAVRMDQTLREHAGELSPAWRSLPRRLLTSLNEQTARLRYDDVVVTTIEHESQRSVRLELVLERASYKGRSWRRLPIQWQPNDPASSLDLGSDEEGGPPLLAWPADADGVPLRTLQLPLGDDPDAPEVRAVWDTLSGSDRSFITELLGLMPILAVHLQAAAAKGSDSLSHIDLQAAATAAMRRGRAALQPPRVVRPQRQPRSPLLQRMAHRLGITPRAASAKAPAAESALDR